MDLHFDVPFQAPFTRKKASTKNLGYLTYQLLSRVDLIISYQVITVIMKNLPMSTPLPLRMLNKNPHQGDETL